jgi:protein involved in polysaccharide export with SLBB domain
MKNIRTAFGLLVLATCTGMIGCATRVPSGTVIEQSVVGYNISPLDEITVVQPSGSRSLFTVDQGGVLDVDGDTIKAQGMPKEKLRSLLQKRFGSGATIEIVEFRPNRVTVLGEVFHQIHTELTDGPMRVMDAIASANGFTPIANKRRVRLLRQNAGEITVYELDLREMMLGNELSSNMLLKPGDVITVPRNFL